MNINLTLIVQMIVFALLVFGTMRWIWPHILDAMEERERKIAQGLAAAEKGEQELTEARGKAEAIVREARERANQIIEHAQHLANDLVEQAKGAASSEAARIVAGAQQQIQLDTTRAKDSLRRRTHARGPARPARGAGLTDESWRTGSPSHDPTRARPSRRRRLTSVSRPGPMRCRRRLR